MISLRKNYIYLISVFFIVFFYDHYLFTRNFPLTEGWWETYCFLNEAGMEFYKDLGLVFTPFYLFFQKLVINFTGFHFYKLKIVFSILFSLSSVFIYLWLKRIFNESSAFIGTLISTFLLMDNVVYLSKDYHTLVYLFISILLFLLPLKNNKQFFQSRLNIISFNFIFSMVVILLCLVKQNVGFLFGFAVLVYMISASIFYFHKNDLRKITICIASLFFPFIFTLFIIDYFGSWHIFSAVTINNDSKGSLFYVLFRFILDKEILIFLIKTLILFSIIFTLVEIYHYLNKKYKNINFNDYSRYYVLALSLLFFGSFLYFLINRYFLNILAIAISVYYLFYPTINFYFKRSLEFFDFKLLLIFPFMAIIYAATTTAGIAEAGIYHILAFFTAFVFFFMRPVYSTFLPSFALRIFIGGIVCLYAIINLRGFQYSWWGYNTSSVLSDQFPLPFSQLQNLKSDDFHKQIFDYIKSNESAYKNFISIPNIPIFYLLLDNPSPIPPVLWFDVTSKQSYSKALNYISSNKPQYIFLLNHPEFAYAGHYKLRNKNSDLQLIREEIENKISAGEYIVEKAFLNIGSIYDYIVNKYNFIPPISYKNQDSIDGAVREGDEKISITQLREKIEKNFYLKNDFNHPYTVFYVLKRNLDLQYD